MNAAQPSLFDQPAPPDPAVWYEPLVRFMRSREWVTIAEVAQLLGYNDTGASARIRDLRKQRFGGHHIDRKSSGVPGCYLYRLAKH